MSTLTEHIVFVVLLFSPLLSIYFTNMIIFYFKLDLICLIIRNVRAVMKDTNWL